MPGSSPSRSRINRSTSCWLRASRHCSRGWSRTYISALLMGSVWAPTSPRPMRLTTSRTSGIVSSRRSTTWVRRVLSVREMDGAMVSRTMMVPSRSRGVNSEPSRGSRVAPAASSNPATVTAIQRRRTTAVTSGR